ncbi:MAG: Gfo/Idh/MocA family oxidoreductase [Planctomycetaceae bacterium]|nr:Gfo/Idh/MocA family oxidoreductase [Planctomycetaceae bacterium]
MGPSDVKQIGIIGAGAIGQKHAEAAQAAGATLRWIADLNSERAAELSSQFGGTPCNDPSMVLNDQAVDAVVIGVPNRLHHPLAVAALEAGKDVLLEKPMALTAAQCEEINDVATRTGRIVQIGFVHRYTAVGRLAKQIVSAGRLGHIYHAKAHLHIRRGVPGLGKWFTTKSVAGGGALIDVGVHLIDLALSTLGYPDVADVSGQVYSTFGRRMRGYVYENMWAGPPDWDGVCDVEDAAHAFVRFRNGATLELDVAWAGNFPEKSIPTSLMGFFGDAGGMTFELFGDHVILTSEQEGSLVDERFEAAAAEPFKDQFADFLRSIETREVTGANGCQGEVVQRIVDEIYLNSLPQSAAVEV